MNLQESKEIEQKDDERACPNDNTTLYASVRNSCADRDRPIRAIYCQGGEPPQILSVLWPTLSTHGHRQFHHFTVVFLSWSIYKQPLDRHNGRLTVPNHHVPPVLAHCGLSQPLGNLLQTLILHDRGRPKNQDPTRLHSSLSLWTELYFQAIELGVVRGCDDSIRKQDLPRAKRRQDSTILEAQRPAKEDLE